MTADHIPRTFQVDLRGLVDLLSHHLYSSPRVYLRELLQNAVDAITARRARAVLDAYGNEGEGDTELDHIPARRRAEARALLDYLD
ncbi:hypothetical protein [Streptomyces tubercidicus]